eukprot:14651490-Alexandrium_andersonii.AAC.1
MAVDKAAGECSEGEAAGEAPSTPPAGSAPRAAGLAKLGIGNSDAPTPQRRVRGKRAASGASPQPSKKCRTPKK